MLQIIQIKMGNSFQEIIFTSLCNTTTKIQEKVNDDIKQSLL